MPGRYSAASVLSRLAGINRHPTQSQLPAATRAMLPAYGGERQRDDNAARPSRCRPSTDQPRASDAGTRTGCLARSSRGANWRADAEGEVLDILV
jgi:hypothetical protein